MGVESYLVLWVFTDECCHPNRFRVELMLIESFEIGRLDFPNRDTLKSTHCFLPNELKLSRAWRGRALLSLHPSQFILQPFRTPARRRLERLVRPSLVKMLIRQNS